MGIQRVEKPGSEPIASIKLIKEKAEPAETRMTEADIENFLTSARQDLDDFVIDVRDSAAKIELEGNDLDQETNEGVLKLIRLARESYQKLENKITRSLEVRKARKQLDKLQDNIRAITRTESFPNVIAAWQDTLPLALEAVKLLPEEETKAEMEAWSKMEARVLQRDSSEMERQKNLIETDFEKAADEYRALSSLSWNDLLDPKHYEQLAKQQTYFRNALTNKIKEDHPGKEERAEVIKKLSLPELDKDKYVRHVYGDTPPTDPKDLLKLIEDSVEEGRGLEYVLYGFDSGNLHDNTNRLGWSAFSEKTQNTLVDAYKNFAPIMFVYSEHVPVSTLDNATEKELENVRLAAESAQIINSAKTVLTLLEMHKKGIVDLSMFSDYQISSMFYNSVADESDPDLPLAVLEAIGKTPSSIGGTLEHLIAQCYGNHAKAVKRIELVPPELRIHIKPETIGDITTKLINDYAASQEDILHFLSLVEKSTNWNEAVKSMVPNLWIFHILKKADILPDFLMKEIRANKNTLYAEALKTQNRISFGGHSEDLQKLTSLIGEPDPEEVATYAKEKYTTLDFITVLTALEEGGQKDALLKVVSENKNKYFAELLNTEMGISWVSIEQLESIVGPIDWKETVETFLKNNDSNRFAFNLAYNLDKAPEECISAAKNEIHNWEKSILSQLFQSRAFSLINNLETKIGVNSWSSVIDTALKSNGIHLNDLLKEMSPVPTELSNTIKENSQALYSKMLISSEWEKMTETEKYLNEPNWDQISKDVTSQIDIYNLANIPVDDISGAQNHFPWVATLKRLKKLQAPASRQEHCPWRKELVPMANSARESGLLSFDNAEDAEIFYGFVEDFGSFKLPILLEVFTKLKRAQSIEDIDQKTKDLLIEALGESVIKKAQNPEALLNEVRKFKRSLQAEILEDKIPKKLMTEIGKEIFNAMRGNTYWSRGSSLEHIVSTWERTIKENPQSAELPKGYEEKTYQVASQEEVEMSVQEKSKKENEILDNKELQIRIKNISETLRSAEKIKDVNTWWQNTKEDLVKTLGDQIQKTQERINSTENNRAHKGMQKNIDRLQDQIDKISAVTEPTDSSEESIVSLMHSLSKLNIKELGTPLQELSALHLTNTAFGNWKQGLENIKNTNEVTAQDVDNISEMITQFLTEHYLNENQENHDQTQHSPFDEDLRRTLEKNWGVAGDLNKHPILIAASKLKNIAQGKNTGKSQDVTYVPQRGLLKIFSGDLGDACYTSRYQELAEDNQKKITAVAIVTNRENSQERLEGSILFVEATKANGEPILVVRANNPRENLLGKVDPNALVESSLEYAKFIAEQRGIKNVGVIRDGSSQASSNRSAVSAYYNSAFSYETRVNLENELETNFNGYNIWDSEKGHPVVEI